MALLDSPLTSAALGPFTSREFPNPRDVTSILLRELWSVNLANYSAVAIGTAHGTHSGFYLMQETPRSQGPGGIVSFERIYHNVWAARDDYESYVFQHPELKGRGFAIGGYGVEGWATATGITTIELTSDHDLSVGDRVSVGISYVYTHSGSTYQVSGQVGRIVTGTPAANEVDVDEIPLPSWADDFVIVSFTDSGGQVRPTFSRVVTSRVAVDYWIVGVTDPGGGPITGPDEITIIPREAAVDDLGAEVNYYSAFTTPTQDDYLTDVGASTEIVAEASQITNIGGNLWERKTRYVTAA